ncbi:interaptin [Sitodiplosis mosellana]|uniref:interaptin n=1 Tax=Sitodiplosis mosellana TaxID=263140 RepID=UPI00244422F3|nr:interaptin [Sitodiplosis mosellana]
MSFSKAKLKRFNEVSDSPYSERMERKDSIRRFLREQFRDDKKKVKQEKESKESKENKENIANAASSASTSSNSTTAPATEVKETNTETKSKSSAYRLFRTPSLPRRLRFNRQHSDLTPSKKGSITTLKEKEKEAIDVANEDIKAKSEQIAEQTVLIANLREELTQLKQANLEKNESIVEKQREIEDLQDELKKNEDAHNQLKAMDAEHLAKINVLEGEIKTIIREQDEEMSKLVQKNTNLDVKCDKLSAQNRSFADEIKLLKTDMERCREEIESHKLQLQEQKEKWQEKDTEFRKLLDENVQLLEGIERIKKQSDDDMLGYAMESQKLIVELETVKREKSKIITELCRKEELLNELQEELGGKTVEMDAERDEIKDSMNLEMNAVVKKYEQQIATLKEVNEMKVKEIESIAVLEQAKMLKDHKEALCSLKEASDKERERINELAEEKIRIAEIQAEQKLNGMDATIDQSIQQEKQIWRMEIEKCQKIAEREIMQCEFEKQDLKTLLDSANDLIREKDEKIDELQKQIRFEIAQYVKSREELDAEMEETQRECTRLLSDRYNYQMALKNHQATMKILMERLKKSDKDVEILKAELDTVIASKLDVEANNLKLVEEVQMLSMEIDEYRHALTALRNSSVNLEREMLEKESVYEKIMSSEQETLETVNKIGKLLNDKVEENISKYAELYNDIKKKYDVREKYIKDMKSLLEEFATGIELARLELDMKEKQLLELQEENKNIKLEIMTYKFKCEQFEKYELEQRVPNPSPELVNELENDCDKFPTMAADDAMVSNQLIENIIVQLEKEAQNECLKNELNTEIYSDEDKITAENMQLKEKLVEKNRQIEFLQEMVEIENGHATENISLRRKVSELEHKVQYIEQFANETVEKYQEIANQQQSRQQIDELKEKNKQLKNKIMNLQDANKENETTISELKDKIHSGNDRTPLKMNRSFSNITLNTPRTPKTPKTPALAGKENNSPAMVVLSPLRVRNN